MNKYRMILNLSKNDFKKKYSGSVLGIVWGFAPSLVTIVVYWFVFNVGFKVQPMDNVPYVVWLVSGLIPWFFFSDAISSITQGFIEYSYLVKKVVFDIETIPYVKLISSMYSHVFFIALLIYVLLFYGYMPSLFMVQIFYYVFALCAFTVSLGYITATLNVFFKDVGQLISVFLQFGIWIVPILWNTNSFDEKILMFLKLNPLFYIIQGYRDSLVYRVSVTNHMIYTAYFWVFVISLLLFGRLFYKKMKKHFADVL